VRYELLETAARQQGVSVVLLGHTRDDQAETVLLGLARGSGGRALAGMAAARGIFRRPLLGLDRATTRSACAEAGLEPWDDPHNDDPSYARVRVRSRVLPVLEEELGPGVAAALERTARLLRDDADALDALTPVLPEEPDCAALADLPAALRSRALKRWAERLSGTAVSAVHIRALRALVEDWSGQGPVDLPGGIRIRRTDGRLLVDSAPAG
jgi:tRNA(Ile)-lysidine synthase